MLAAYVQERERTLKASSIEQIDRSLVIFLRWLQGPRRRLVRADALSRGTVAAFYDHMINARGVSPRTARWRTEHIQRAWRWLYENEDLGGWISRPARLEMPTIPREVTKAPTFADVDAAIEQATGPHRRLLILLRFLGLRLEQARSLTWDDFDLEAKQLHVRGELGKTVSERSGRHVPISPHLVELMSGWGRRDGTVVDFPVTRVRIWQLTRRAWERSGVDSALWGRQPHHSLRKAFVSELRRSGGDWDAVEYLVGHALGIRGVYTDPTSLRLVETVSRIPRLGGSKVVRIDSAQGGKK